MNPSIKYSPKKDEKRKIVGVAIILKEFLNLLDKYDIEHDPEKVIRKYLCGKNDYVTSTKQYFLSSKARQQFISRKHGKDVRCRSCVCIPRKDLPERVLELLSGGRRIFG